MSTLPTWTQAIHVAIELTVINHFYYARSARVKRHMHLSVRQECSLGTVVFEVKSSWAVKLFIRAFRSFLENVMSAANDVKPQFATK